MPVRRTRRSARKSPPKAASKVSRKATAAAPSGTVRADEPASPATSALAFPVVGLGASAGGLEAFEEFVRHVPPDVGMAFVLVSHLDPSHESILTEILQRVTPLPVVEVTDQLAVKPGHVYVIPPNRDLTIFHGVLQLTVQDSPRGQRMPIDAFFRSLAEDQGEQAMGVVLSGTGSDGTLGLRAILGAGGVTFAQEPSTARYDGMPAAAIRAGYAAHVLPPGDMPEVMRTLARVSGGRGAAAGVSGAARGLAQVLALLRSRTGHDFSQYKKTTVVRRVERRMAQHGIATPELYARYLKERPAEVHALFTELLINVTSFFRDPEAFETLCKEVFPVLLAGKPEGWVFRGWIAGCASGEEAYSIAILLREWMDEHHLELKVQLYATDLDEDAINVARAGVYPPNVAQDVSPERLRRFFVKDDGGYRIKKEIREMVVFAVQNVIKDPPFTRLDLIACRNLLIYLEPEMQDRLISIFHYALRPGGVLLLAPSESLGRAIDLFRPVNRKWKVFQVVPSASAGRFAPVRHRGPRAEPVELASEGTPALKAREANLSELTTRALLKAFAPTAVVTDRGGNVVYVHGDTSRYLRPAPGKASLNVIEMARGALEAEVRSALRGSSGPGPVSQTREVSFRLDGAQRTVRITVGPLAAQGDGAGLLLVGFQEVARPAARGRSGGAVKVRPAVQRKVKELEAALAHAEDLLRDTVDEQQASTEELKSTNEELQSTNEELQSTNEELETSKEELQSVNEELVTVNAELQAKVDQLAGMQNDMRNLLENVSGGVIFLDAQLAIRRFTREATRIFRLVASDEGRPLADIKGEANGDDLLVGAQLVLDTLVPWERELVTAGGATYLARIQPYRTLDNVIDGVVMTFTDITSRVQAQAAVEEARRVAESIVDAVREPLLVLDASLRVTSASRSFYETFLVTPEETLGRALFELGDRQWDTPVLREMLDAVRVRDRAFDDLAVERDFPRIGHRRVVLNARRILRHSGKDQLILLAIAIATARDVVDAQ